MLKIQGLANASSQNEKLRQKLAAIEGVDEYNVDDLGLDFTVPGYDIELKVRLMLFPIRPVSPVLRPPRLHTFAKSPNFTTTSRL